MIVRSSNILGLAFSDRAVTCVEIATRAVEPRRAATFTLPTGVSMDAPDALGTALATFLRQNEFTARRAVVGVPARWLIAVERDELPFSIDQAKAALRLQVERMGASDGNDLIFDYAGELRTGAKIVLVGMMRKRLGEIQSACKAAGLSISGVTSTAMALAESDPDASPETSMLIVGPESAEVVWRHGGTVRQLRHLSVVGAGTKQMGIELRRAVAMAQGPLTNGTTSGLVPRELLIYSGAGLSDTESTELSGQVGLPIRSRTSSEFAPARALAVLGATRALPVDLLHSRLAPRPASFIGRRGAWVIAFAATLLVVLVVLYVDLLQRQNEAADLQANLTRLAPDVKNAENLLARFNYAKGFFETRPPVPDAMLEIARTFRDDEAIWVTHFGLRETRVGTLQGKAREQRFVLSVLDRMKKNPKFADVKLLDMRNTGAKEREESFSISFNFKPG